MPDLRTELRTYVEATVERVDAADVSAARAALAPQRRWYRRPVAIVLGAAAVVLVLGGGINLLGRWLREGEPPVTITVVSTTLPPTTTVSPTTAAPTTTAAASAVPPSGVYIVDPQEYPNGFMLWGTDLFTEEDAQAMGLGWTAVGYSLPEGGEIVAPFDGTLRFYGSAGNSALVVNQVSYAKISVESADELIMVFVGGPGLTYSPPGQVAAGAVIARVTDPSAVFAGLEDGLINTIIQFGRFEDRGTFEAWWLDVTLLHDYFAGLLRYP